MLTMANKLKHEITQVDKETGEIITTSKTFSIKTTQDTFYMSYIEYLSPVLQLKSQLDKDVLMYFCMMAEYNTGKVSLSTQERQDLLTKLDVASQALSRSVNNLKEVDLISGDRGLYYINPKVFWKGTNETRDKLLKDKKLNVTISFEK